MVRFFFFKQKTAYEMRISDWSSDVCSSDLLLATGNASAILQALPAVPFVTGNVVREIGQGVANDRSEPALLAKLISDQVLRVEELSGPSLQHFFDMVAGQIGRAHV